MFDRDDARGERSARVATLADTGPLSDTLMRAFLDDPLIAHFLPDAESRPARLRRMFALLFAWGEPYGACHVTTSFEAAILWRPPHQFRIPYLQYLVRGPELLGIFGTNAWTVARSMNRIESAHPKAPNWYLQAVGTDPALQGKGWGGTVIRKQLALADAAGEACYLESSKQSNIPIYERLGFSLRGELRLPKGPTIWPMWREPMTKVDVTSEK